MNFAEGKGPKQVKKPYVLGQFATIYGNDGIGANGAPTFSGSAYTSAVGTTTASGTQWTGGLVGSVVPGLNINVNGNGVTDVGFVCSPGSNESVQDTQYPWVTLNSDANYSGTTTVTLQGTSNRYLNQTVYSGANWVGLASTTITGANAVATITGNGTLPIYNAYRLVASGATATGIISWAIAGMFTDFSAMGIGNNASDANGNIGQLSVQGPRYLTIQSGQITNVTNGTPPYAATKNNVDYYG